MNIHEQPDSPFLKDRSEARCSQPWRYPRNLVHTCLARSANFSGFIDGAVSQSKMELRLTRLQAGFVCCRGGEKHDGLRAGFPWRIFHHMSFPRRFKSLEYLLLVIPYSRVSQAVPWRIFGGLDDSRYRKVCGRHLQQIRVRCVPRIRLTVWINWQLIWFSTSDFLSRQLYQSVWVILIWAFEGPNMTQVSDCGLRSPAVPLWTTDLLHSYFILTLGCRLGSMVRLVRPSLSGSRSP